MKIINFILIVSGFFLWNTVLLLMNPPQIMGQGMGMMNQGSMKTMMKQMMPDQLWNEFKKALPDSIMIGRALSAFVVKYLESDDFERLVMLNPEIPMRDVLREEIKGVLAEIGIEQGVLNATEKPKKAKSKS